MVIKKLRITTFQWSLFGARPGFVGLLVIFFLIVDRNGLILKPINELNHLFHDQAPILPNGAAPINMCRHMATQFLISFFPLD